MQMRAKIFRNGGSQAVRLPKECRFKDSEVNVRMEGSKVILEPIDEWPAWFRESLTPIDGELPRPRQGLLKDLKNPFV